MTPHNGAGAGQAFEDGYILAALLAQPSITPATLGLALQIYDCVRRPFAQDVERRSRYTGMLYEFNGAGCEVFTEEESAAGLIPQEKLDETALEIDNMFKWVDGELYHGTEEGGGSYAGRRGCPSQRIDCRSCLVHADWATPACRISRPTSTM